MQTLTEKVLRLSPPGGLFDETVVRNLFPDRSEAARKVLVHRAAAKDEIIRLKPGLFLLSPEYRKSHPHPFVVAAALHSPSHVSLESALSHHGLIPEAVYQVSCVTSFRSRTFHTPIGVFTFSRVPVKKPRAGVIATRIDSKSWVFIASPVRAIADLVYLNKQITWEKDGLSFLTESMRIERETLEQISFDNMIAICEKLRDRRTQHYLTRMHKELADDR
jgi:hypothetical protein